MSLKTKRVKFEPLFEDLKQILNVIYSGREEKVSSVKIYQLVYDICTARYENFLEKFFFSLVDYYTQLAEGILERLIASEQELLLRYSQEFEIYSFASRNLNLHCGYFNDALFPFKDDLLLSRVYSGEDDVIIDHPKYKKQTVLALAYAVWVEVIILGIKRLHSDILKKQIQSTINKERNGGVIDLKVIRNVIHSFVELNSQLTGKKELLSLALYQTEFENDFLQEMARYYKAEAELWISEFKIAKYLAKAESRIKQEIRRNELILHSTSLTKALDVIQTEFLKNHKETIYPSFKIMIDNENYDDCHRMYNLMASFKDGIIPLQRIFEDFVLVKGKNALAIFKTIPSKDPREYVDLLLEVHHKYTSLCQEVLNNDPLFITALDKAFRRIINSTQNADASSPELLAKYADILLKKSNRGTTSNTAMSASHASLINKFKHQFAEGDLECQINELIVLFKYIDDKDVFQKFYSRFLAKRLIHGTSISEEAESSMISKFKMVCGLEYTSKLHKMIADISLNAEINKVYKHYLANTNFNLKENYQFLVLTAGAWPLNQTTNTELILSNELAKGLKVFTTFYNSQHSGRKLNWIWHLCKGDVRLNYLDKNYEIGGNIYQLLLLLLFNNRDSYTVQELIEKIGIQGNELKNNLKAILDSKVLLLNKKGRKESDIVLNDNDEVSINFNFTSKRIKLKFHSGNPNEASQDAKAAKKELDNDRVLYLQSMIVRIMKSRQQMSHQQLVNEVIKLSQNRFTPSIPLIKKNIDVLIDKLYLERKHDELDYYVYLA